MAELDTQALDKIEEKSERGEKFTEQEEALLAGEEIVVEEDKEVDLEKESAGVKKEKSKEETADKTPAEKDAEAAKAKEKEAADTAAKEAERRKLIEAEAEKPLDEAKIEEFSQTERALFYELRKERRKRQDAQRDLDTFKFQKEKDRLKKEAEDDAAEKKAKEQPVPDPFEGMEDDDILTVGQIKKVLKPSAKSDEASSKKEVNPQEKAKVQNLILENWALKAQKNVPDIMEVLPYDEILEGDLNAVAEVRDVAEKDGNPLIATYNLIKAHPRWPEIEAKIKAKKEGAGKTEGKEGEKKKEDETDSQEKQERKERIEKNNSKSKTTGGGGSGSASTGEYTLQEIADMSEAEFAKLPKSTRDKILEQLG